MKVDTHIEELEDPMVSLSIEQKVEEMVNVGAAHKGKVIESDVEAWEEKIVFSFKTDTGVDIQFGFSLPTLDGVHDKLLAAIDTAIERRHERLHQQKLEKERAEKCRNRDREIAELCNEALGISDYSTMVKDVDKVRVVTEGHRPYSIDIENLGYNAGVDILCIPCQQFFSAHNDYGMDGIVALYNDHLEHEITLLRPCGLIFAEGKKAGESCKAPGVWVIDHKKLGRVQRCGKHSMKLRGSRKKNKKKAEQ